MKLPVEKKIFRNLSYLIVLFLGIAAPSSIVVVVITSLVFGFLLKLVFLDNYSKNILLLLLTILIYCLIIYTKSSDINYFFITLICILSAILFNRIFLVNPKKTIWAVLTVMVLGYGLVQIIDGTELRKLFSIEPINNYNSDMSTYIKVVYLMKKEEGFYQSLANVNMIQFGQYPPEIWGWRQPFLFYLWKVFPGDGKAIIFLSLIIFSTNLIAAYFIGRKFLSPLEALLCPYMIWPYFRFPLVEQTVAQVEWWALSAFIWGVLFLLYYRYWLAGLFFAVCLGIRELFLIHILALFAINIFLKKLRLGFKLILPTLFLIVPFYFLFHIPNIAKYDDINNLIDRSTRKEVPSGWKYIRPTLSYNSQSYALYELRPFLVILIFNSIILLLKIKRDINHRLSYILLLGSFLPFFIASLKIGTVDLWHDYWGIYYVPLLLLTTPIAVINIREMLKIKATK